MSFIVATICVLLFFLAIGLIVKWSEKNSGESDTLPEWWTKDNKPVSNEEIEKSFDEGVQEHLDAMEEDRKKLKDNLESTKSSMRKDLGSVYKTKPTRTVAKSSPKRDRNNQEDDYLLSNLAISNHIYDSGGSSGSSSCSGSSSSYDSGSSFSSSSDSGGGGCF